MSARSASCGRSNSLKAGGREDAAFAGWSGIHAKVLNTEHDLGLYSAWLEICPALLSALSIAVVLAIGVMHVIDGVLTLGGLVAFQSLMASFEDPINTLVQQTSHFHTIKANIARMQDVFNYPAERSEHPEKVPANLPPKLSGRLELTDVQFGYSILDPPLIDGFSLSLEPGMRAALVGISGSGKSSLGRVICGLYQPWAGEIRFDGRLLAQVPADVLANSVAYVDQDILLFEGTLRENLTLWDSTVAEIDISRALQDAMIHDEAAARPGRYDCYVAEDGTNFSGGQQQRIEIARALTRNPTLLVLDEATAALEPTIEKAIHDNLRHRGCTCIVIAHRLSTIRDCDQNSPARGGQGAGTRHA